ncbi:MAG: polysaccharide pyruvyl transferase family protein [Candidatus Bilamarchaeaceae archaeon]
MNTLTLLLFGNGSFRNHGCEAIARGTIVILQRAFGDSIRLVYAAHNSEKACAEDTSLLGNDNIIPVPFIIPFSKYSKAWFEYQSNRFFNTKFSSAFRHLRDVISQASVVISISGDNYSLDYGYPEPFVQFDRLVIKHQKPLFYWGASIGPFSTDPCYERKMQKHLQKVTAILAREYGTVSYLYSLGITKNVHLVADPAFAMSAVKPDHRRFMLDRENFVGVNFSTTVARLLLPGQRESDPSSKWSSILDHTSKEFKQICNKYAEIAASLMKLFDENLVFVPHVTGGQHCDYKFLNYIADLLRDQGFTRPLVVPDNLTAPEYKWIISQARVFIGARTHSTIAAFSSGVPTISLAYSLKARGLTQDMYGTNEFCIEGSKVTPEKVSDLVKILLANEQRYRNHLVQKAQVMTERAFLAGKILADFVERSLRQL